MQHHFLLIAFLTVSLPILIHSEEILMLNDGSKIIIKDNKTWEYFTVEKQNNNIISLIKPDKNKAIINSQNDKYSVYYDSKIWETTTGINQNAEFQFVNKEKTGYAFIIYEALNITMNQYMESLSNFTKKSGANTIEEKTEICLINDKEGRIRNMQVELRGLRFKMLTLVYTGEEGSIQFTAYTLDSEFEKLRPIFIQLLSGLVIN